MKKKVLVVEDSFSLAKMISAVLKHAEYEVMHAENGEAALEFIQDDEFNLIMLDLMMPIMDGKEFLQRMRTQHEIDTPVLVYTGSQGENIEQELLDAGANQVVFKPLGAQSLLKLINENIT